MHVDVLKSCLTATKVTGFGADSDTQVSRTSNRMRCTR